MHLVVLYKSVITGLLWILLLSGEFPSSYLSLRKEIKVLDSGFPWNLSLGTEACNKLGGGEQVPQNCVKVSDLVKLSPPDLHRAAFVGLGCLHYLRFLFLVWDVGAEENSGVSLALSSGFVHLLLAFHRVILPFFLHGKSSIFNWS